MRSLVVAVAVALGSASAPAAPMEWRWAPDTTHRWYLESEVVLPGFMWLNASANRDGRVSAFQVRAVLQCRVADELGRRGWDLDCVLHDVSLSAVPLPGDEGTLAPILAEHDALLTGASVELGMRRDGRLSRVDLAPPRADSRRQNRTHENLRLVVARALAGLDMQLPRDGSGDAPWLQMQSPLAQVPTSTGSRGAVDIVHERVEERGPWTVVRSAGAGTIVAESMSGHFENPFDLRLGGDGRRQRRAPVPPDRATGVPRPRRSDRGRRERGAVARPRTQRAAPHRGAGDAPFHRPLNPDVAGISTSAYAPCWSARRAAVSSSTSRTACSVVPRASSTR